ncbi:tyrosine-type recombinase/integrase [Saccharospirillum mangrovi]|uniref:tyrosine-type recombinase/integrase n=1 Tax=Saccharospirillum mangrovi TaxID=2161747 RepID=UPI001E5A4615|nr:site-specific integrase [Saccharospirillum mangrovi]
MTKPLPSPIPIFDNLSHFENPFRHRPQASEQVRQHARIAETDLGNDLQLCHEFLYSYRGSSDTFASYRREIERFMQWCWFLQGLSLAEVRRQHIEAFVEFCQDPPRHWIGTKSVARFRDSGGERVQNPEWKPFVAKVSKRDHKRGQSADIGGFDLSQSALQAIFSILSTFFNYLLQEEHVELNPVAQIRQKGKFLRKRQGAATIRRLSEAQWHEVLNAIENAVPEDPERYERALFIVSCLFGMYLRISELAETDRWQPSMGDFTQDAHGNWWFTTVGKGNKERDVSVSDAMLLSLRRFRAFLGQTPLPLPGESAPLIPKVRGKGGITSTRQIRFIVQECFDLAIERLRTQGEIEEADALQAATVHWLRHTGISEDVKTRPREHVRDDAGHGSSAITDRYIDVERQARHASARHKKINPVESD